MQNKPFPIIPDDLWGAHGSWRQTLHKELARLETEPVKMLVKTIHGVNLVCSEENFRNNRMELNYAFHTDEPLKPVAHFPSLGYTWGSTSGKDIDQLIFQGSFDREVLERLISTLVEMGLELTDRWSLVIVLE